MTLPASALALGCLYGLLAMSYALAYHLCGTFQYAHGDLLMAGGYAGLFILEGGGSLFFAFCFAALSCGLFSLAAGKWIYAPLRTHPPMASFLGGIGLSFFLQAAMLMAFSAAPRAYPGAITGALLTLAGRAFPQTRLLLFAVFLLLFSSLSLLYAKSPWFLALRAAAADEKGAASCGISRAGSALFVFFLSGALAGVGGVLYGLSFTLSPVSGTVLGLRAFCAACLGGDGSPLSACLGGMALGLTECLLAGLLPTPFLDAALFFLLFLLLFTRRKKRSLR